MWIVATLLTASGCAGVSTHDLIASRQVPVAESQLAGTHQIFVATTREPAEDKRIVFSGKRSPDIAYAKVDVTVPATHKPGQIERPKRGVVDPARYFAAARVTGYRDTEAFDAALKADIARNDGRALVFIHGFNTHFDDAIYRLTQIVHDSGYSGTPVLFTWASAGRILDYVYDNNSAHAARDALEATLRLVARSGARRVDIIAHSMGGWVTMEALRQLAITGNRDLNGKLGDVVLASPDIDIDVFESQMKRYGVPDKPFVVLVSQRDRALSLSGLIAGNRPRLGGYTDAAEIARYGVSVVDVSNLRAGDRLNHTTFAENPGLIRLIGERLAADDMETQGGGEVTDKINTFAQGIGQTVSSAAEIIITTPVQVLRVAVGQ